MRPVVRKVGGQQRAVESGHTQLCDMHVEITIEPITLHDKYLSMVKSKQKAELENDKTIPLLSICVGLSKSACNRDICT